MRGLILALQFLTRLPTPAVASFSPQALARCVPWFPLVGLLLGLMLAGGVWLGSRIDPWLGALMGLLLWVGVTGALHLDGLSDLADALGAAHGRPERFLLVLADPHVGVFGVVSLVLQLLSKLVLLLLAARLELYGALILVPAWARLGVLWWAGLPPIKPGLGERFAWRIPAWAPWSWLALLAGASLACPILLLAPLALLGWHGFLRRRLGGMSGDALGAGVELTESLLLGAGVLAAGLPPV
ncbi:MAG TPA: adenosylcobinamide-GDP ribazoletransferase [Thiobacillaceae bacterium]|nr:adenosylcobinamide-GDP ribazoletransferase [Thiobacillaceae bacterium]HNU64364.1 adenosylcobinamide-GDP ribazoletransferase [Thiobacillaceae bacterium]